MKDWRELVTAGKFEEAEPLMLEEAATPDGYGGETVMQAEFYEAWGDGIGGGPAAIAMYRKSHYFWATFASWSTSGGEGTGRMRDANRVLEKIAALE